MKALEVTRYKEVVVNGVAYLVLNVSHGYDGNVHLLLDGMGWVKYNPTEELNVQEMTIPF